MRTEMSGEEKFWCWIWIILGTTVFGLGAILLLSQYEANEHERHMAEQGYQQIAEMLPGEPSPVWTWKKPDNEALAN